MKFADLKDLAIIGAIVYAIYWISKNKDFFDPTSDKNIAYQTANEAFQFFSNGRYLTVGDWLTELWGEDMYDPVQFSPFTRPDGSRGSRVTRVVNLRNDRYYRIDYSTNPPRLIAE